MHCIYINIYILVFAASAQWKLLKPNVIARTCVAWINSVAILLSCIGMLTYTYEYEYISYIIRVCMWRHGREINYIIDTRNMFHVCNCIIYMYMRMPICMHLYANEFCDCAYVRTYIVHAYIHITVFLQVNRHSLCYAFGKTFLPVCCRLQLRPPLHCHFGFRQIFRFN